MELRPSAMPAGAVDLQNWPMATSSNSAAKTWQMELYNFLRGTAIPQEGQGNSFLRENPRDDARQ